MSRHQLRSDELDRGASPTPEHEATVHEHPLNDGTSWFRVTCTCGWANPDPEGRIYSKSAAIAVRNAHTYDEDDE